MAIPVRRADFLPLPLFLGIYNRVMDF